MKRTISLKPELSQEQSHALLQTQQAFTEACNAIVPFAVANRCWNRVDLHHLSYQDVGNNIPSLCW